MGDQHHSYTGILLVVFAIAIALMAIFFTMSYSKVLQIQEYKNGNSKLNTAKNLLLIAFILAYAAAGIGVILAILYFGHVTWGIGSEVPHLILFILLFLLIIASGILGGVAISYINSAAPVNNQSSTSWAWAGLIAGLIGLVVLVISGAWRAQYVSNKPKAYKNTEVTFTKASEVNIDHTDDLQAPTNAPPPPPIDQTAVMTQPIVTGGTATSVVPAVVQTHTHVPATTHSHLTSGTAVVQTTAPTSPSYSIGNAYPLSTPVVNYSQYPQYSQV